MTPLTLSNRGTGLKPIRGDSWDELNRVGDGTGSLKGRWLGVGRVTNIVGLKGT